MEYKRIVIGMYCGTGTDSMEAWLVPADIDENTLEDLALQSAMQHAEMYGIYPPGELEDWDSEEEWDEANHDFEAVDGWWENYNADKHDGRLLIGTQTEVYWNKY